MTSEASFSGPVDLLVFGIDRKLVSSCTTSSIAILSMFYFIASRLAAEKLCKVTANFPNRQIFRNFFFRTAEPGPGPGRYLPEGRCAASAAAPASFPKAGAKVRTSHIPSKFLCDFF